MGKKPQAGVQHLLYQLFIITLAPLNQQARSHTLYFQYVSNIYVLPRRHM